MERPTEPRSHVKLLKRIMDIYTTENVALVSRRTAEISLMFLHVRGNFSSRCTGAFCPSSGKEFVRQSMFENVKFT